MKRASKRLKVVGAAYQFVNLTLQVLDAVQLSFSAALSCDAVFTAPSHVVDEVELI